MRAKGTGWKVSLSIVVGVLILALVLHFVGWRETLAEMGSLGIVGLLAVLGNIAASMALWMLSWWAILNAYGVRLPLRVMVGARLAGYAVSYLTPTLYFGGEPIRAMLVVGSSDAPATRIAASIIVERFLGGLSMILFVLIGGFFALTSPAIAAPERRLLAGVIGFVTFWVLIGFINFAGNFKWISRLIRCMGRLMARWKGPLERAAAKVSETEDEVSHAFSKHSRATLLAFLLQIAATCFVYTRPQFFFFFFGVQFTFPQLSLLFAFTLMLSFFLWITPGGLGTSEAGLVGAFVLVRPGLTSASVVAYALVFKFFEAIFVVLGMIYLARRGIQYLSGRRSSEKSR